MNAITQSTLAKPDTSWRRKRSPDTTMSSQNHNMNMNIVKASAIKLLNVNPPSNGIAFIPCPKRVEVIVEQCQRHAQRLLVRQIVIARSAATKQSREGRLTILDCFASLAMTRPCSNRLPNALTSDHAESRSCAARDLDLVGIKARGEPISPTPASSSSSVYTALSSRALRPMIE
jgi:hypothetical protein